MTLYRNSAYRQEQSRRKKGRRVLEHGKKAPNNGPPWLDDGEEVALTDLIWSKIRSVLDRTQYIPVTGEDSRHLRDDARYLFSLLFPPKKRK